MKNMYTIQIHDRNYTTWDVYNSEDVKMDVKINPLDHKMFTNDVFSMDEYGNVTIIHSSIRSGLSIPGVLVLEDNKTYGREHKLAQGQTYDIKKEKMKGGRLLYKCIPDNVKIPPFLVPYEIKTMGFSKVFENVYVTICFDSWQDKHPRAKLNNVIGPVSVLEHFYEYQLYCKSLHNSIQKFQKDATCSIGNKSCDHLIQQIIDKYPNIQDRTDQTKWQIMSIDPPNSQDMDDAFSIINIGNTKMLSIYISNVTLWIDILQLWSSFSKRTSTIYLPDKKRPMMPTILSDSLCSLQENVKRVAFVMDLYIQGDKIERIEYNNAIIKVSNNYIYEETKLLENEKYKETFSAIQIISKKYKYINNVKNSHDLICYLMILMNYYCAKEFIQYKTGIFRSTAISKEVEVPNSVPENVATFIKILSSYSGQYVNGSQMVELKHELLNLDAYIHITSPIRRLVDLLNMIRIQQIKNIVELSEDANEFYNNWLHEIDYINTTMHAIRKIQCNCSLLELCYHSPEVMEKEYDCYLFDKICRSDQLNQYIIFLPELKMSSRLTLSENYDNFTNKKCKLYLFYDEDTLKRKIRIHILE